MRGKSLTIGLDRRALLERAAVISSAAALACAGKIAIAKASTSLQEQDAELWALWKQWKASRQTIRELGDKLDAAEELVALDCKPAPFVPYGIGTHYGTGKTGFYFILRRIDAEPDPNSRLEGGWRSEDLSAAEVEFPGRDPNTVSNEELEAVAADHKKAAVAEHAANKEAAIRRHRVREIEAESEQAWPIMLDLEARIIAARAATILGVAIKLQIWRTMLRSSGASAMSKDDALVFSAFEDTAALCQGALVEATEA